MALRALSNMFRGSETRQIMAAVQEHVFQSVAGCVAEVNADVVNIAAATVLLDFAVLYQEQPNSDGKNQCLSILVEMLKKNTKGSVDLLLRVLSAVGTCLWKDQGALQMAQLLDVKSLLPQLDLQGNHNLTECTAILTKML